MQFFQRYSPSSHYPLLKKHQASCDPFRDTTELIECILLGNPGDVSEDWLIDAKRKKLDISGIVECERHGCERCGRVDTRSQDTIGGVGTLAAFLMVNSDGAPDFSVEQKKLDPWTVGSTLRIALLLTLPAARSGR